MLTHSNAWKNANQTSVLYQTVQDGTTLTLSRVVPLLRTVITSTPGVTASSAYSSGECVGGLLTLANAVEGGDLLGGVIQNVVITDKDSQSGTYDIWFFDASPATGSTITDHSAFAIGSTQLPHVLGYATVSTWSAASGGSIGQALVNLPIFLAATSLYAVIVTRSTQTFTTTSSLSIRVVLAVD